jgi:hypothetical protein
MVRGDKRETIFRTSFPDRIQGRRGCSLEIFLAHFLITQSLCFHSASMPPVAGCSFSEYQSQRSSLVNEDRSLRREFLPSNLKARSDREVEADKIVRRIRSQEAETIWRQEYPLIPHPFPGMEFLTGNVFELQPRFRDRFCFRKKYN